MHESEILEWYRQQYNIPLQDFYTMNIDEDLAHVDFYRRQFWNELRYGVREWGDFEEEFKIPAFTLYRGNGGTLPIPNGYGFEGTYSIKVENYSDTEKSPAASSPSRMQEQNTPEGYTYTENNNVPSKLRQPTSGLLFEDETNAYKSNPDDFASMLQRLEEGDDSLWEELERIPGAK